MLNRILGLLALAAAWAASASAFARSPDTFDENYKEPIIIESPQWLTLELRLGPYTPGAAAFKDAFGDDHGWLFGTEFDAKLLTLPYVGQLAVGAGFGWAKYSAKATTDSGAASGESTKMTLFPLSALAVLRVDTLARHTVVPVVFAGKIGADFVRWKTETGASTDANGVNIGLRWAAQAALELDAIDMRSARRMDEDFGINHTMLFFEFYESMTRGTGDRAFSFGLGMQF